MEPDGKYTVIPQDTFISIHGLRMEPDEVDYCLKAMQKYFNPRAPYGARPGSPHIFPQEYYFNPRAPYGARLHVVFSFLSILVHFNPRAPYGARLEQAIDEIEGKKFQSTGSVWSPTYLVHIVDRGVKISIHGLRMEPDIFRRVALWQSLYFNPRAPYGARPKTAQKNGLCSAFQSTGSVWSPTANLHKN